MIERVKALFGYLWRAKGNGQLASPFARKLYEEVIARYEGLPIGKQIEAERKRLAKSSQTIDLQDFGAGHGDSGKSTRTVTLGKLAREAACPRPKGELLFRLAKFVEAKRILEFGTQLGFSGWYMQAACPDAQFVGMEGDPTLAGKAVELFDKKSLKGIIYNAVFQEALTHRLALPEYQPDFVYLDGHHTYEATLDYTRQLLPHMPENSLLILDDIYWSAGMRRAWEEVCQYSEVSLSVDLFQLGLCFVKQDEEKQHLVLRRWR